SVDPDVALMLRVQAGEQAAFQELFRKYSPRVLQYVRRMLASDARAEEVTQDVFVQVFRFRARYRPESRFSTWVFTIATNLCLNELRRPERQLRVDLWDDRAEEGRREGPSLADPAAVGPEEGASARELSQRLDAAIRQLPEKQRAALLLSRIDGLAYTDVARARSRRSSSAPPRASRRPCGNFSESREVVPDALWTCPTVDGGGARRRAQ